MNLYAYCGMNPVGSIDPWGLWAVSDFFAGAGDTLSFGLTKIARKYVGELMGIGDANESVDYDSGWYTMGVAAGILLDIGIGVAGGWQLGARALGREFSHWIPVRIIKRIIARGGRIAKLAKRLSRSRLNGNFVTPAFHSATDQYRYLQGQTKASKFMYHPLIRHPLRMPFVALGGILGALLGGGHALLGSEADVVDYQGPDEGDMDEYYEERIDEMAMDPCAP